MRSCGRVIVSIVGKLHYIRMIRIANLEFAWSYLFLPGQIACMSHGARVVCGFFRADAQ